MRVGGSGLRRRRSRGYLNLTMRALKEIRSIDVGRIKVKILVKLREALKDPFVRRMEDYGVGRARCLMETWDPGYSGKLLQGGICQCPARRAPAPGNESTLLKGRQHSPQIKEIGRSDLEKAYVLLNVSRASVPREKKPR